VACADRRGRRALYVRYASSSDRIGASQRIDAMCHKQTHASQQKSTSIDQLAISAEQLSFSDWKLRITSFGLST
jgi:hypothetical protein